MAARCAVHAEVPGRLSSWLALATRLAVSCCPDLRAAAGTRRVRARARHRRLLVGGCSSTLRSHGRGRPTGRRTAHAAGEVDVSLRSTARARPHLSTGVRDAYVATDAGCGEPAGGRRPCARCRRDRRVAGVLGGILLVAGGRDPRRELAGALRIAARAGRWSPSASSTRVRRRRADGCQRVGRSCRRRPSRWTSVGSEGRSSRGRCVTGRPRASERAASSSRSESRSSVTHDLPPRRLYPGCRRTTASAGARSRRVSLDLTARHAVQPVHPSVRFTLDRRAARPMSTATVVGGGPAGLMAAEVLARAGVAVTVYDRMPSPARKFLLAGHGGLNLTHSEDREPLPRPVRRAPPTGSRRCSRCSARTTCATGAPAWGSPRSSGRAGGCSRGRSARRRWSVPGCRGWPTSGCASSDGTRWTGWTDDGLRFDRRRRAADEVVADVTVFALGGASWPRLGSDGGWVGPFTDRGVAVAPLRPANVGMRVGWTDTFADRFEGTPLKHVALTVRGRPAGGARRRDGHPGGDRGRAGLRGRRRPSATPSTPTVGASWRSTCGRRSTVDQLADRLAAPPAEGLRRRAGCAGRSGSTPSPSGCCGSLAAVPCRPTPRRGRAGQGGARRGGRDHADREGDLDRRRHRVVGGRRRR